MGKGHKDREDHPNKLVEGHLDRSLQKGIERIEEKVNFGPDEMLNGRMQLLIHVLLLCTEWTEISEKCAQPLIRRAWEVF